MSSGTGGGRTSGILGVLLLIIGLYVIMSGGGSKDEVEPPQREMEVAVSDLGGDFTMTGPGGSKVSLNDFRGKAVLLFFGYTYCPYACPTTLIEMDEAMTELGDLAGQVQVLYISVDPKRDTPERLKELVTYFNPAFIGLTGTRGEIDSVTAQYGATYLIGKPDENGEYAVGHTTTTYLIDQQGKLKHMFPLETPPEEMADAIRKVVLKDSLAKS